MTDSTLRRWTMSVQIEEFEADQLIEIRDFTDQVSSAVDGITDDQARSDARTAALEEIESVGIGGVRRRRRRDTMWR